MAAWMSVVFEARLKITSRTKVRNDGEDRGAKGGVGFSAQLGKSEIIKSRSAEVWAQGLKVSLGLSYVYSCRYVYMQKQEKLRLDSVGRLVSCADGKIRTVLLQHRWLNAHD
jgi:hypothetical protein